MLDIFHDNEGAQARWILFSHAMMKNMRNRRVGVTLGVRARFERVIEVPVRDEGVKVVAAQGVEVEGVLVYAENSVGGDVEVFIGDGGGGVVGCAYALR